MEMHGTVEEVEFVLKKIDRKQFINVKIEFEENFNKKVASGRKKRKNERWEEPEFYKTVKIRLAERSMSLLDLCDEVNVKPSYLSQILFEKRKGAFAKETRNRVAAILDLER